MSNVQQYLYDHACDKGFLISRGYVVSFYPASVEGDNHTGSWVRWNAVLFVCYLDYILI